MEFSSFPVRNQRVNYTILSLVYPIVWYTQFYGIRYHDTSLVKNSNLTQPQSNLIVISVLRAICTQYKV
jgi:hypothetical protein